MAQFRMKQQWMTFSLTAVSCVAFSLTSGCASSRTVNSPDKDARDVSEGLNGRSSSITSVVNPKEIIVNGVKLKHTDFDYPITVNNAVEKWVDYFTGRGRPHMEKYLARSELFIPFIQPILKQSGIPEDLVYLAMIESGFHNHARSFAKAVGPWQFMPATGKRYGMSVNWWVDERRDTRKSTIAAAQYLKELYGMFGSWELAAAGYNAGETKVARAVRRYGTTDFWAIARQRFLRPETRNYVPKIIAAALVSKNRTQFGFPASAIRVRSDEAVAPDGEVVKLENEAAQPPTAAAKEALESVLRGEDYETASTEIEEDLELAPASINVPSDDAPIALAKSVPVPFVNKKGELTGESLLDFEVQSPADLLTISRAAGLSYHTVKSLNPEILRWCTPPNLGSYRIRLPASSKDKFLGNYNSPTFEKKVSFLTYKVKRGQSLQAVAQAFSLRVDPLADLNGISARGMLRKGMLIRLPMPSDRARNIAALEIRDPPEKRKARVRSASRRKRSKSRISLQERYRNRRSSSMN